MSLGMENLRIYQVKSVDFSVVKECNKYELRIAPKGSFEIDGDKNPTSKR